ncbi:MAG TPA: P-II family nitrogen regulator [Syntrophorhabdaceae bacterium]|nr:P-II family nitrogen regulator [Syntrophorhabdaceae bacterium]
MKKIEVVIASFKVNDVKRALTRIGITKMTVSKMRWLGGQAGYCRGGKYESKWAPAFLSKTKIDLDVAEKDLERVLGAIEESAEGTVYGDDKVFVYSLDDIIELRGQAKSAATI